jgi:hypothetical protein
MRIIIPNQKKKDSDWLMIGIKESSSRFCLTKTPPIHPHNGLALPAEQIYGRNFMD